LEHPNSRPLLTVDHDILPGRRGCELQARIFCDVVFLSTLSQLIADASLISAKPINLTAKKYFDHIPLNSPHIEQDQ
jgi:hypothetical protein